MNDLLDTLLSNEADIAVRPYISESNTLYNNLKALSIADLAPVCDNGVRGRTLSAASNRWMLSKVYEAGVKTIIDLRKDDYTNRFELRVNECRMEYFHFPMDKGETDARVIIDAMPRYFSLLDRGGFYIACAMGLHRTDIAIAVYYVFHPAVEMGKVPELRGHRTKGRLRCDDIARRLNSIMNNLTQEDLVRLELPDDFEREFKIRKKLLFRVNSVF